MDSVSYSDSCEVSKESWRESFHKLSDVNSTPEEKMCSQFLVSVSDSSFILSRTGLTPNPSWLSTLRLAEENIHECVCGHMSVCVCVCVCVCVPFTHSYIIGWTEIAHYIRPPLYVDQCTGPCSGWYQRTSVCDGARWREHEVTVNQLLGHFSLIIKMSALVTAARRLLD